MTKRFRFRPRYRGIAWSSVGVGGSLAVVASVLGFVALPLVTGLVGVGIGAAYLGSPTWRLEVIVDDEALEVASPKRSRFKLLWSEVVKVTVSPATSTCFVDGGTPERSLLVPGDGAPAPYDLEDRKTLVAEILARVPADKVETVETLEQVKASPATKP
ncbi:MAG: hypothetical protein WKG01_32375 [Kofleriaceae bacterium]